MNNREYREKITELKRELGCCYKADPCAREVRFKYLDRKVEKNFYNTKGLKKIYEGLMKEIYGDGGLAGF